MKGIFANPTSKKGRDGGKGGEGKGGEGKEGKEETKRAGTLKGGEGSFGFRAVTEITETPGRKHYLLAGQETKLRREFCQGPCGPGARCSPWPAQ